MQKAGTLFSSRAAVTRPSTTQTLSKQTCWALTTTTAVSEKRDWRTRKTVSSGGRNGSYVKVQYPNSNATQINGINDSGVMVGMVGVDSGPGTMFAFALINGKF